MWFEIEWGVTLAARLTPLHGVNGGSSPSLPTIVTLHL